MYVHTLLFALESFYNPILNFIMLFFPKNNILGRGWVAQLVKHRTLNFCSGHDLTVHGIESCVGLCADSVKPAWDSPSPSLSAPPPPLSQNKQINLKNIFYVTYEYISRVNLNKLCSMLEMFLFLNDVLNKHLSKYIKNTKFSRRMAIYIS